MARYVGDFFHSIAGRIFVLLTTGMIAASIISLAVAERARQHDLEQLRLERMVASVTDIAQRLYDHPEKTRKELEAGDIFGAHMAPEDISLPHNDPVLVTLLAERLGAQSAIRAAQVPSSFCMPMRLLTKRAAGIAQPPLPDCWMVRFVDRRGTLQFLAIDLPMMNRPAGSTLNPFFLSIVAAASALLALVAARLATRPMRRLQAAAQSFSRSLDSPAIAETGPADVRAALATFNLMQQRVRAGLGERIQILAAISHDLQTPITRLRLRLEKVGDPLLRDQLIADLATMQLLVRQGLDLASSRESDEEWMPVDVDSFLASKAEDAAEFGGDARFVDGCRAVVQAKPTALARCLDNLVDNALKYGGRAELSSIRNARSVEIHIRDYGPGITGDPEIMFKPFTRGETSRSRATGGTGLGLPIARAQAATFGARVELRRPDDGGQLAVIILPLAGDRDPIGRIHAPG